MSRRENTKGTTRTTGLWAFVFVVCLFWLNSAFTLPVVAQQTAAPAPASPPASELTNKLTLAYYSFSSDRTGGDINLRHTFDTGTAWIGAYTQSDNFTQVRLGYEYDYRNRWLTAVPSAQLASHGFAGATVYTELGRPLFAIAGAGRTNLKPYWNLGFDPNDYIQVGVGYRDAHGSAVSVYAIHDNRLGTGQTNTHFVLRRYLPHEWRLTADIVREHGNGDEGLVVRDWSVSADIDWRRWFVRVASDPHVNYTADHQVRVAGGVRF